MIQSRLKVAVIGAGMIASKAHIPAYLSLPEQFELASVCDSREEGACQAALEYAIPHWYTDAEKMLREIKPDLVSVCTPNASHPHFVRLALEAGANVLCEKPLAMTWEQSKELFDLADSRGKMLMACQTLRFSDEYQAAKELAGLGELGQVYFAEFSAIRRRGIPKWGAFHLKESNGGGCLCDLGVHLIDAALWLMGSPSFSAVSGSASAHLAHSDEHVLTSLAESGAPAGVTKVSRYEAKDFEVEEFAAGFVRFQGGAVMNFKTAWAINLPPHFNLSLAGTKSGMTLPDLKLYSLLGPYQADIIPRVFQESDHAGHPFAGHFRLILSTADHLINRAPIAIKPQETLQVAAIIDAFYLSASQKREVRAGEIITQDL